MDELRLALNAHPDTTVGFVNVSLDQPVEDVHAWIASHLAEPQFVGIGELTPAPGAAGQIEPVLQVSADHAGVPVLTHGFAPNTSDNLTTYANLAGRYPSVPLIVGAFGGLNCLQLIDLTVSTRTSTSISPAHCRSSPSEPPSTRCPSSASLAPTPPTETSSHHAPRSKRR